MIFETAVPEERQALSRKAYTKFVLINGFAYSCLGDTVIILLAVQLKSPDWVISTLGSLSLFGFLLLPLGRMMASRVGAARSQHCFWVARNCSALLVAAAVPVYLYAGRLPSMLMMLAGGFFFYGFRAAGVVMEGPLIGDMTNEDNRPTYIASISAAGYALGVVALTIINLLVYYTNNNLWTLTGVVVAGAFLGIQASSFLSKVDETRMLQDSAKKPVLPQCRELIRMKGVKRLLVCTFFFNLSFIMLVPISLLTLKRGYHISDTGAVAFSIIQWTASSITPFFTGRLMHRIGPRKVMVWGYLCIFLVAVFWILLPLCNWSSRIPYWGLCIPFVIGGTCSVASRNALTHYYLESIEKHLVVTYATLSYTIGGALAGLAGIAITGVILSWLEKNYQGGVCAASYAIYFIIAVVILLPGVFSFLSLKPLSIEQRERKRNGHHLH